MAYDEELAERIRELIPPGPEFTERKMFGGLAFLIRGNMAVAASGQGGLLVRVDPDEGERLLGDAVQPMVMGGREMAGWLRVTAVDDDGVLREWVERGVAYARTLPPKKNKN
ncbi:TfoX/Sxy family protein [Nocardia sp. CY41]|uniref:TfoX/Sxy family protein n=1 Tax=Nocardia sp. CY41 TaxID=2608686 RepID=UPI00135A9B4B|nr:TfoX/Sxy family protein [Nocardia sp. CY41]